MVEAMASFPINFGNFGKGNSSDRETIIDQAIGGAAGMKIHEDWSASPAAIRTRLSVSDEYNFQDEVHADTLNETGYYEDSMAAIGGRVVHVYHCESSGGAMLLTSCAAPASRTSRRARPTPTNPFSINAYDEARHAVHGS
jgi:urease subunit alpha